MPLVLQVSHAWLKIGYSAVKRRELHVVLFGDFDAVSLPEFHDDVQEIHGVHFDLVSNPDIPLEFAQILIWQYLANHLKMMALIWLAVMYAIPLSNERVGIP